MKMVVVLLEPKALLGRPWFGFGGPPWDHTVSYDRGPGKAVRWRPAGKEASKH